MPLILECDASAYGVGACLMHKMPDGSLLPVCYVSRSLAKAECNYSQIEREGLAIVYAVKRLHQYVYGQKFLLRTDHKPLLKIFGEKEGLPSTTAARLQRWAVVLSAYDHQIQYVKGGDNVVADCLSRLPVPLSDNDESVIVNANDQFFCPLDDFPITAANVATATQQDTTLSMVMMYVKHGWPTAVSSDVKPFVKVRNELSIEHGCLLWQQRVVVPVVFRRALLSEVHAYHLGVSRMKSLARGFFWWPGMDDDIVLIAAQCDVCQRFAKVPPTADIHHWAYASQPFERVHADFAEFESRHYLLLVDSYSKYVDVYEMDRDTSTKHTIHCVLRFISAYGSPTVLVTDNGPQFTAQEFELFCSVNGIKHKKTPPYHPASNGQVERVVQELKKHLRQSSSGIPESV